ncbi:MAG: hypothetical protein WB471_10540 [Nocardioides sp.]
MTMTSAVSAAATPPVGVSISKARVITMPATVQPGVNRFAVTSARKNGSAFQLVRPAPGYSTQDASRDIKKGLEGSNLKALKRFEANVTLLGGVTADKSPDTLVVDLDPGTHWALDTNTSDPSKFFVFDVSGDETGNASPQGTAIRAKSATTWAGSPKSIPREGLLNFKNDSSNNHFIVLTKLKKGKSYRDFKKWFATEGEGGPPPVQFNVGLDSGVVSPGHSAAFSYDLPRGSYVMLCFWPDAEMDGMPHAYMGMHRGIKLT